MSDQVSMTEDQDLLAKISQLAGQINQHKNQTASKSHPSRVRYGAAPYSTQTIHSRNHAGWAPYRGRTRPHNRHHPAPHRNRTLVINNQVVNPQIAGGISSSGASSDDLKESSPQSKNGWVAKRDRHMQLINSAIFDKETQARAKAIEESRKLRAQKKAERDELRVLRYAQAVGGQTSSAGQIGSSRPGSYQILIQGLPFQVARGGSKLIRLSNDPSAASVTPKKVNVGGVNFVRSKKGNLHRLGAVVSKNSVGNGTIKKKNELCKRFTATGSCHKGPSCPYIHDADKVAICKEFLQTGKCGAGLACDLSHDPSPERSPACLHFLRGRCSNPSCRYTHIRVTPGAPVCRDFAILGYCSKGAGCDQRHVHECPDYANTGNCGIKRCQLPHVDRAGQIRKIAANKTGNCEMKDNNTDDEDITSEEEYDEIDSDDIDSDDLEEDPMETTESVDSGEISQQQDFVRF